MITATLYRDGRRTDEPVDLDSCARLAAEPGAFLWLDVTAPADGDLELLASQFGVHPLTVEDMAKASATKIELFQDYAFVVLRPVGVDEGGEIERHRDARARRRGLPRDAPVRPVASPIRRGGAPMGAPTRTAGSAGFAVYVLIDEVVDGYLTRDRAARGPGRRPGGPRLRRAGRAGEVRDPGAAVPPEAGVRAAAPVRDAAAPGDRSDPGTAVARDHGARALLPRRHGPRDPRRELADNVRDLLTSLLEVRVAQAANR